MKKIYILITLLLCLFSFSNVYAEEEVENTEKTKINRHTMELIPIDEVATVETNIFMYNNFKYIVEIPNETYAMLEFDSVTNKTKSEKPLSVSVLLFNEEKKNIGYVAYCSTKDLTGDYAQLKVNPKASSSLTIKVDRHYFTKNYTRSDVKYIAIKDDNDICFVGDEDKYGDLTISQINKGKLSPDYNEDSIYSYLDFIVNMGIYMFLFILMIIMSIYTYIAIIMNKLNKAMFDKKTKLAFIPFVRTIISMNLSFGRIIAVIHLLAFILSIVMLVQGNGILFYIVIFMSFVSFIVVLIKYYKNDYNLLFFDPFVVNDGKNPVYNWRKVKVTDQRRAQQVLDLSYNNAAVEMMQTEPPTTAPPQIVETQDELLNKLEQQAPDEQTEGFADNSAVQGSQEMVNPVNSFLPPELQEQETTPEISPKEAKRLEKEKQREEKEKLREEKRRLKEEKKNKKNNGEEEKSVVEEALAAVDDIREPEEEVHTTNKEEDMSDFMDMFK